MFLDPDRGRIFIFGWTTPLKSWLSGAAITIWNWTRSKQWRWSWTSGESLLHSPHSPSWTALWLQWLELFQFLGITISQDNHIDSIAKKAQQWLYFLPAEEVQSATGQELLKPFYSAIIEFVLCSSITVWFGSATKSHIKRLQRRGLLVPFCPASKNFTPPEWGKGLRKSLWTPHTLSSFLPSGRRYRELTTRTARPQAIFSLNN